MAATAFACRGSYEPVATGAGKIPITCSSQSARDAYLAGRFLLENLRATDARRFFQDAVAEDPDFALAHLGLANTAQTNNDFFASMGRAAELAARASDGERRFIESFVANMNGEPDRQFELLEELLGSFPDDERVHQQIGIFHFFTSQDYGRAAAHFRRATEICAEYSPAYNLLGYSLRFLEDYQGAEEAFQSYIALIPDEPNPYDSYAELLMKMGRFDDSIAAFGKALEVNPTFVNAYVGIANNQIFKGEGAAARATLGELREKATSDAQRRQACTWTAASYVHDGNHEDALDEIQRRYDIAAETDDRGAMSADLDLRGDILLHAELIEEALDAYSESVTMMERSTATAEVKEQTKRLHLFDVGRVALARGDLEAAAAASEELHGLVRARMVPFELRQAHELSGLIALAQEDYRAAVGHLDKANQQNPRVLFAKARALFGAGDEPAAREACRRAADFNGYSFDYAFVRGEAMKLLER
jgi:tetratricopeptide (TPR) repeat protein